VGLGKTFTALAVVKYYELRNKSVLVLCPKKLADNWLTFNHNLKTNLFARDRFSYDVLGPCRPRDHCHTPTTRGPLPCRNRSRSSAPPPIPWQPHFAAAAHQPPCCSPSRWR
jgi:hypothetical protein